MSFFGGLSGCYVFAMGLINVLTHILQNQQELQKSSTEERVEVVRNECVLKRN